jgi:glucose-6-phosphate isomerase
MSKDLISFDYNNIMADVVGDKNGVTKSELDSFRDLSLQYLSELRKEREEGKIKFYDLPNGIDSAKEILKYVKRKKDKFDNFVVLGI